MTAPWEDEVVLAHVRECFDYSAASLQTHSGLQNVWQFPKHQRWSQITKLALIVGNDTSQAS